MKHTPGPWTAEFAGVVVGNGDPLKLYEITNGYSRIAENVAEADALLISAAPELLAALEHMIRWHDQLQKADLDKARAAIAKATGAA